MTQITVVYGVLGEENLIDFFKESFELDFNKQQFIKPMPDFVLSIYLTLLDNFNLNIELNNLPYLQKVVTTTYCIQELLNKCNIFDFKISDILQPKRKRTQIFVSQLVGIFLEMYEFNNYLIDNQLTDENDGSEAIENEKAKIARLENEIAIKKQNLLESKPELDKYRSMIEESKEQMRSSRTRSEELETKATTIKKERTQLNSILSTEEYEKLNVNAEVMKLEDDLKLITGNSIEQADANKKIANDLRKECVQIQEQCRELLIFKNFKKENINDFRYEQDEINRNRLILKQNLNEKENFQEKNKMYINDIENLKKKSIEIEDDYNRKIKEKEKEVNDVQMKLEPVNEMENILRRELKKKLSLEQEDEDVSKLNQDSLIKQQETDYYIELKNKLGIKFNSLHEDCLKKLSNVVKLDN